MSALLGLLLLNCPHCQKTGEHPVRKNGPAQRSAVRPLRKPHPKCRHWHKTNSGPKEVAEPTKLSLRESIALQVAKKDWQPSKQLSRPKTTEPLSTKDSTSRICSSLSVAMPAKTTPTPVSRTSPKFKTIVTLDKLTLENFKNDRAFVLEPKGKNLSIYADNGKARPPSSMLGTGSLPERTPLVSPTTSSTKRAIPKLKSRSIT